MLADAVADVDDDDDDDDEDDGVFSGEPLDSGKAGRAGKQFWRSWSRRT